MFGPDTVLGSRLKESVEEVLPQQRWGWGDNGWTG